MIKYAFIRVCAKFHIFYSGSEVDFVHKNATCVLIIISKSLLREINGEISRRNRPNF